MQLVDTYASQPWTQRSRNTPLSYDAKSGRIAYGSGKLVVLRDVKDPTKSVVYGEHLFPVTAVSFAPSGFYIASADASGKVRVWSVDGEEFITKAPVSATSGRINAIAWDFESKRIIAVGEGKERFGHCFTFDSGNSVGEISGHPSVVNGLAIKPNRPMRAVTVGEDGTLVFYKGAPYQFDHTVRKHTGAISAVAYSPDGSRFASVGSDHKLALYDGATGEFQEFVETGHTLSILAVAWKDKDTVVTASADSSVRVTDVASGKPVATFELPKSVDNHQTGVVVAGEYIISVGLNGDIYYWTESSSEPERVLQGHQKGVTALTVADGHVYSASSDGKTLKWTEGAAKRLDGGHEGPVVGFVESDGKLCSAGWDHKVKTVVGSTEVASFSEQPKAVASSLGKIAAAGESGLEYSSGEKVALSRANAVDIYEDLTAVGYGTKVVLLKGTDKIHEFPPLQFDISVVKFSLDGKHLAAGDSSGKIIVYKVAEKEILTSRWAFHTSRVTSIAWHPDNERAVTGGSDTNIFIYSVKTPGKNIKQLETHRDGVTGVSWLGDDVISAGADGCLRLWKV